MNVQVTCSFGVADLKDAPPALVELADEALYRAKQSGRNQVTVSHPDSLRGAA